MISAPDPGPTPPTRLINQRRVESNAGCRQRCIIHAAQEEARRKRLRQPMHRLEVRDGPRMLTRWPGPHAYGARPSPYSAGHGRRSERAAMVPAPAAPMRGLGASGGRPALDPVPLRASVVERAAGKLRDRPAAPVVVRGLPPASCPQGWLVRAGGAMRSVEGAARKPDRAAAASAAAGSRTQSDPPRWQAPRRWRRVPSPHRRATLPV
jgi:hypothetical protein